MASTRHCVLYRSARQLTLSFALTHLLGTMCFTVDTRPFFALPHLLGTKCFTVMLGDNCFATSTRHYVLYRTIAGLLALPHLIGTMCFTVDTRPELL